jgi:TPR repeat protein
MKGSIFFFSAFLLLASGPARAEAAGDCHRLAADPSDPDRLAPGVAAAGISFAAALAACRKALAVAPGDVRLGYQLGRLLTAARDPAGLEHLEKAAKRDYRAAQHLLGLILGSDYLGAADGERSRALIGQAAAAGHTPSQVHLARLHWEGSGVKRDLAKALRWYRAAADKGSPEASVALAEAHLAGEGVAKDAARAFAYLALPLAAGDNRARTLAASLYVLGEGVAADPAKGRELLEAAAGEDHLGAALNLGIYHHSGVFSGNQGKPTEADREAARDWLCRAGLQGRRARREYIGGGCP